MGVSSDISGTLTPLPAVDCAPVSTARKFLSGWQLRTSSLRALMVQPDFQQFPHPIQWFGNPIVGVPHISFVSEQGDKHGGFNS